MAFPSSGGDIVSHPPVHQSNTYWTDAIEEMPFTRIQSIWSHALAFVSFDQHNSLLFSKYYSWSSNCTASIYCHATAFFFYWKIAECCNTPTPIPKTSKNLQHTLIYSLKLHFFFCFVINFTREAMAQHACNIPWAPIQANSSHESEHRWKCIETMRTNKKCE